jgi:hypothetical protein
VGPNAKLLVLMLLPLVAEKSGPASVSLLAELGEADRRTLTSAPALSTLDASKERSGPVFVLVTLAPS